MDPDAVDGTSQAATSSNPSPVSAKHQQQRHRRRKHRAGLHRIAIACERCRVRKNKCDGATPVCTPCDRAGAECIVLDRLTHRPQARDHVDTLERENESLRAQLDALQSRGRSGCDAAATFGALAMPLSAPSGSHSSEVSGGTIPLARTALGRVAGNEKSFVGESGGSFFGDVVQNMLQRSGIDGELNTSQQAAGLRSDDQAELDSTGIASAHIRIDAEVLPMEMAVRLENAFFEYRWPTLPILHWPSFREQHMMPFLQHREQASSASIAFVTMVMAIGAVDLARRDQSLRGLASILSRVALSRHLDILSRVDDLATVQMLVLEALYAISEPCSINAWHTAGQAVRVAIALGLHRQGPAGYGSRSRLQTELRKRVFWCAFAIDQNISMALGRPAAIRNADIDAELPLCLSDADLTNSMHAIDAFRAPGPRDMSTFIHIVNLRRLRAQTQETLYLPNVSLADLEVEQQRAAVHRELDDWVAKAPRFDQSEIVTYQTTEWFQISYSQSLLLLYRPSPACPVATAESLKILSENAIAFITSYSSLYAKNKIAYTWLSLHSLFMASVTMLYAIWISPLLRADTTLGVVKANVKLCIMLFEVMEETWPLAARCRAMVERIGDATLKLFEYPQTSVFNQETGMQQPESRRSKAGECINPSQAGAQMMSVVGPPLQDMTMQPDFTDEALPNLDDWYLLDFDMNLPLMTDAFNLSSG